MRLASESLPIPLLGLLLAVVLAVHGNHWILGRLLAVASAVGGLVALVVIPLFAMDTLDARAGAAAAQRTSDLATLGALLGLVATVVFAFAVARGAWVGTDDAAWDARHSGKDGFHFLQDLLQCVRIEGRREVTVVSRLGTPSPRSEHLTVTASPALRLPPGGG